MEALYFEVHISIDCGPCQAREILKPIDVKVSQIVGDEPDVIVTLKEKTLNAAVKSLENVAMILVRNDIEITRHKIEMAVIDSNVAR